ncbi:hypothetical protein [Dinghuibacter silviterrae]|uniref:Uncharacterized protein n=1 Tax=Dinghuibacter silviterrae TaxID=1539049 RepID=A0A4R8DEV2_9BACT|nr:hypothetical protein [Dinghuibacter silviterrae]TDW96103.1 hypothetical protein EDB95_3926 [Dinghuibacter silviterrae]
MKDKQQPPAFLQNSVPVDEAVVRTTNWRHLYKDAIKCEEKDILRAFYIPIEDIICLYEFYQQYQVEVKGVRGYFGHNPNMPIDPTIYETEMLLCPVDQNGCDILTAPPSMVAVLGDSSSTIYDFTAPCPVNCDTASVLYSETNALKVQK